MRKIDWEKPLSDEDMAFLSQAGIPGTEDRVRMHQAKFKADVYQPETPDDTLTRSALDAQARVADQVPGVEGAILVDPTDAGDAPVEDEPEADDYDQWKVAELEREVAARNELPESGEVTVIGTGRDGNVTKPDLIKGLRLWDQENPDALKD